jgi:glycosyltransferase
MKIVIITATFNCSDSILNCIESVVKQTYPKIEHIIVDGLSNDNTIELIKSVPNRVSKIISEPDSGVYDALNKGIKLDAGDVIGFLHADDVFASENTIAQIADVLSNPHVDGIYGDLIFVNNDGRIVRYWKSKQFNQKDLKKGWMPPHPTLFLRKEVYEKLGLFNDRYKISGDYEFMLRLLTDSSIQLKYISGVITYMKLGGKSTGNLTDIIIKSFEDYKILKKYGFNFPLAILFMKNIRKIPQLFLCILNRNVLYESYKK